MRSWDAPPLRWLNESTVVNCSDAGGSEGASSALTGSGRVFTITISCTDGAGHTATKTVLVTVAHVCRVENAAVPGWFGVAASFGDVRFDRDDGLPSRFLQPQFSTLSS